MWSTRAFWKIDLCIANLISMNSKRRNVVTSQTPVVSMTTRLIFYYIGRILLTTTYVISGIATISRFWTSGMKKNGRWRWEGTRRVVGPWTNWIPSKFKGCNWGFFETQAELTYLANFPNLPNSVKIKNPYQILKITFLFPLKCLKSKLRTFWAQV